MFPELRDKVALSDNFVNPFSRRGALWLSAVHPHLYLACNVLLAVSGYLFLFLFPMLLVAMPIALYSSLPLAASAGQWFIVGVQAALLLLGGVTTYMIFTTRFSLPSGLELTEEGFPRLFELLRELGEIYGEPRIDRVVLRDRFDVRIIKTPRNGFPVSTTHTLVIGLPVLLTLSPMDVHALLARRIGQLAGKHSRITSWLFFLRDMWGQYLGNCGSHAPVPVKPVCAFFSSYVPLYRSFSVGLARRSELEADRYALEAINDTETARAISGQVLVDAYLARTYWPNILQNAKQSVKPRISPHAGMVSIFKQGLSDEDIQAALHWVEKSAVSIRSTLPGLAERLDNIGHRKPIVPEPLSISAAQFYLGGACGKCIEVIDKRSLKKVRTKVISECSPKGN
jgi:hypothetical protein